MIISPTEFKCEVTTQELIYIRKGLHLLRKEIQKKPKTWKNNGKDAYEVINYILDETKNFV